MFFLFTSHEPPEAMFQTAGILLSLKHSSLQARSIQEGCMNVQGFPYLADTLNQFQSEKSPKTPFDLLSYTGGIFNNVLQVKSPERVATAIGFAGLNCFIPQFGDFSNGYYHLPSPLPNGSILKGNHLQTLTPSEQFSALVSGNANTFMSSFPLRSPDGSFFGNGSSGNTSEASSSSADQPIDVECEEQLLSNQNGTKVTNPNSPETEAVIQSFFR